MLDHRILVAAGCSLLLGCAPELHDPPAPPGSVGAARALAAGLLGNGGTRTLTSVAVAPSGQFVLAGYFEGTFNPGDGPMTSAGSEDTFVAGFSAASTPDFAVRMGGLDPERAHAVALDAASGIAIAGELSGSMKLGTTTLTSNGGRDAFLASLDAKASPVQGMSFGDGGYQAALGASVGADGGAIIAGISSNGTDASGMELGYDAFVAAYDSIGKPRWVTPLDGPLAQRAVAVAVAPDGSAVVVGDFEGTLQAGSKALTSAGARDVFVVKLGPGGEVRWALGLGDAGTQEAAGVALDAEGHALVLGSFSGSIALGDEITATAAENALFVAKVGPGSEVVYLRSFGETGKTTGRGIAVGPGGDVVVAADCTGRVELGDRSLESVGAEDVLVMKLDASGQPRWAGLFGDEASQQAVGVGVDGAGNAVVIGEIEGTMDYGAGTLESVGARAPFWMRISP